MEMYWFWWLIKDDKQSIILRVAQACSHLFFHIWSILGIQNRKVTKINWTIKILLILMKLISMCMYEYGVSQHQIIWWRIKDKESVERILKNLYSSTKIGMSFNDKQGTFQLVLQTSTDPVKWIICSNK